MSTLALYRKYRSQDFDELIGQEHVSNTLKNAIKSGRISHAYLFTGPRGTGKTSVARILAKQINKIKDSQHEVDIIEIDAASNNGVDEIRELREKVHIAPNYCNYKVYIIDEVHMLSGAAFNALLKTLEEPPSHVIFILATTEPHKLPKTIVSRTQHFPFYPVSKNDIVKHLAKIAKTEKIKIDKEALELIAELGEGSVRDSISMLDQLAGKSGDISADLIRSMVGIAHNEHLQKLMQATIDQQPKQVIQIYDELLEHGISLRNLNKQLLDVTRQYVRTHITDDDIKLYNAQNLLKILSSIPTNSPHLDVAIEAALLSISRSHQASGKQPKQFSQRIATAPKPAPAPATEDKPAKASEPAPQIKAIKPTPSDSHDAVWVKTLSIIKQENTSLYSLLRNMEVDFNDNVYSISAQFKFHHRKLQQPSSRNSLRNALDKAGAKDSKIKIVLAQTADRSNNQDQEAQANTDEDALTQVVNILGGEVIHG